MAETTKLTYHVYRPEGGEPEHHEMQWSGNFQDIRGVVNPLVEGRLEHVTVLFNGKRADMFVEEESAKKFPPNEAATAIYHASSLSREPGADTSDWPKIYGVAVVFDQIVWT